MNVLELKDFYKYSWFSNMSYVLWDANKAANTSNMVDVEKWGQVLNLELG